MAAAAGVCSALEPTWTSISRSACEPLSQRALTRRGAVLTVAPSPSDLAPWSPTVFPNVRGGTYDARSLDIRIAIAGDARCGPVAGRADLEPPQRGFGFHDLRGLHQAEQ